MHRARRLSYALLSLAIAEALCAMPASAQTLPGGFGNATNVSAPTTNGNTMTVDVTGNRAYAEWNSFNVGNGFTFNVTNGTVPSNYIFVNRVTGPNFSGIDGLVQANGHVWLINPNGIVVGSTGVFDVGGLLLSTATTLNGETAATHGAAFLSGTGQGFSLGGANANINVNGRLVADIGAIALIANNVNVKGTVDAGTGEVALVGAKGVTIGFDSDLNAVSQLVIDTGSSQQVGVQVDAATFSGARTIISAAGMSDLSGNVVLGNNVANSVRFLNGDVVLYAAGNTEFGSQQVLANSVVQPLFATTADSAGIWTKGLIDFPGNLRVTAAGGLGVGGTDVMLRASGAIDVVGGVFGRDVGLLAGGALKVDDVDAQDDATLIGDGLTTGQVRAGRTVDGLAATDESTLADMFANTNHAGSNDVDLSARSGLATINANAIVPGNYSITGGDFTGGHAFSPVFGGNNSFFRIVDNAGGLTLGGFTTPGSLSVSVQGGPLTVYSYLASTRGSIWLWASGDIVVNGELSALGADQNIALTSQGGSITQNGNGALLTGLFSAGASSGIDLNNAVNHVGSASLSNQGGGGVAFGSNDANYRLTGMSTIAGNVQLDAANGVTLSNATVSNQSGNIAINGSVLVFGSSTVNAVNGEVAFSGKIDGTQGGTTNPPGSLTVIGPRVVSFGGAIGATSPLDSLFVIGPALFNGFSSTYVRSLHGLRFDNITIQPTSGPNAIFDGGAGQFTAGVVQAPTSDLTIDASFIQAKSIWAGVGPEMMQNVTLRAHSGVGGIELDSGTARTFRMEATGNINVRFGLTADRLSGSAGGTATFWPGNHVQTLGDFSSNGLTLSNVDTMRIDGTVSSGISNTKIEVTSGDLQIAPTGAIAGRNIELAASGAFINQSGADAIAATGRWLVFSSAPGNDTFDGLDSANTAIWGNTSNTLDRASVAGNRYVFAMQPTLTFTTTDLSKIYGADATSLASSLFTVSGFEPGVAGAFLGDDATTAFSGAPDVTSAGFNDHASVAGGPYVISAGNGTLASSSGYQFAFNNSGRVFVSPKAITGTPTVTTKTYDGNRTGSGTIGLSGVLAGDNVAAIATFTYLDKNAGISKTVTITGGTLTGVDAGNYTLTLPTSALGDILKRALTGTVTIDTRTYDGTLLASGTIALSGVVAGEHVGATATFAFTDKNAGTTKTVTIAGAALSGADAGNYTLAMPATAVGTVLKKALTGTPTITTKTYDGTTTGSGTIGLSGVVDGDQLGATASFTFTDKNAGTGKTVTIAGGALSGADAGNYTLALPATAVGTVLQKALTGTPTVTTKTYDGTTTASGTIGLAGVVTGDQVGATATFTYLDENAGTSKTVTIGGATLTGTDAGNYTLTLPSSALGDILQRLLTGTVSVETKTYDGTATGRGTISLAGVLAGDNVGATATFTFSDKNAANGKVVTISGVALSGADAGNYRLTVPATAIGNILRKAITGTATVHGKSYDGNTTAQGTIQLKDVINGDVVNAAATFTFSDPRTGKNKTVTISAVALSGADAGNYSVTLPASALASIVPKVIDMVVSTQSAGNSVTTIAAPGDATPAVIVDDAMRTMAELPRTNGNAVVDKFSAENDDEQREPVAR